MNRIQEYYDIKSHDEWNRLERHPIEYAINLRAMKEYLPPPPAQIIDIGGACGRYSIELSRCGYQMTLVDISGECLALAQTKAKEFGVKLESCVQADGRDLSLFADASFDAVLLMGPLYHLLTHEERLQAVREAYRVLRPGGEVFSAFICRYAVVQYGAKEAQGYIISDREELEQILETGVYHRPEGRVGFIDAWFAHPDDVSPLMAEGGFEQVQLLVSESLVSLVEEKINGLSGEVWDAWIDLLYRIANDPSILGAAEHLLYVGQKPEIPL